MAHSCPLFPCYKSLGGWIAVNYMNSQGICFPMQLRYSPGDVSVSVPLQKDNRVPRDEEPTELVGEWMHKCAHRERESRQAPTVA